MDLNNGSPVVTESMPMDGLGPRSSASFSANSVCYTSRANMNAPRRKHLSGKLDEIIVSGLLDAMRSTSPSRKRRNASSSSNEASDELESAYNNWLVKHPPALTSFESIICKARGKNVVLLLDYDGTLAPIVNDPDKAFMSNEMRATVKNAAKYFPTAIVSGRSRDKVFNFVKLTELYYAGSHGMDITGPVGTTESMCHANTGMQGRAFTLFQPAKEFLPMMEEVFRSLIEATKGIDGVKVEDNKFCVSVHYRNVLEEMWDLVGHCVKDVLSNYPNLRLTHGRKVLEVRPVIDWNKGKAVEFLLNSLGLTNCDDVLPIYIGDDKTDEDAFQVLRNEDLGWGILVSAVPKETSALYSLHDPLEVMLFLKSLVEWRRRSASSKHLKLVRRG